MVKPSLTRRVGVAGTSPMRKRGARPLTITTHHSPLTNLGWERSRLPGFPHIRLAVCLTSVGGEGETEPGLHSADVDYESRKVHAVVRTGWELSAHGRAEKRKLPGFAMQPGT